MRRAAAAVLLAWSAAPAASQTLDELLARNLEARGGAERLRAARSVRMTGTMSFGPGLAAPFTLEMKRPNRMRVEFEVDGQTGVQAFDGRSAWMSMPFLGRDGPEEMPAEEARQIEEQADFDGPLVDWREKGHRLTLVGRQRLDGAEAWKLELVLKSRELRHVYLDAATFLEVRVEGSRRFEGRTVAFRSNLGDYREVDGRRVPFSIESGPLDAPEPQRLRFERIEFGVEIDDARFRFGGAR